MLVGGLCGGEGQAILGSWLMVRDVVDSGTGLEAAVLIGHLP